MRRAFGRLCSVESSSARFAEAATEAARVGMLDETGQASKEAEAKHAAEVAVKTEWSAKVEALLEAQESWSASERRRT